MPGRGFELHGSTFRFRTEAGHVYVTVNADGDGRPLEVFVRTGRCGSTLNSLAEALGRLASLALRSGADPEEVARQLRGIKSIQTRQEAARSAGEEGAGLFLRLGAAGDG